MLVPEWVADTSKNGYSLPFVHEWENACRGGAMTTYPWGDDSTGSAEYGWFHGNGKLRIQKTGQKKPNGYGLYDMCGNVLEWTQNWVNAHSKTERMQKGEVSEQMYSYRTGTHFFGLSNECPERESELCANNQTQIFRPTMSRSLTMQGRAAMTRKSSTAKQIELIR